MIGKLAILDRLLFLANVNFVIIFELKKCVSCLAKKIKFYFSAQWLKVLKTAT